MVLPEPDLDGKPGPSMFEVTRLAAFVRVLWNAGSAVQLIKGGLAPVANIKVSPGYTENVRDQFWSCYVSRSADLTYMNDW